MAVIEKKKFNSFGEQRKGGAALCAEAKILLVN